MDVYLREKVFFGRRALFQRRLAEEARDFFLTNFLESLPWANIFGIDGET